MTSTASLGRPAGGFGKYLGIFTDRLEVNTDQKIMETLMRGIRRAAGLTEEPHEGKEEPEERPAEEQFKPN